MFLHPLELLSHSGAHSGFSLHHPWSRVLQQTRGYGWWLDVVLEVLQEPTSTDLLFPWETICNTFKQCLTSANTPLSFNCWARQIKYKYISGGGGAWRTRNRGSPFLQEIGISHQISALCWQRRRQILLSDNCEDIMQCNFLVPYTATIYGWL